MRKKQGMLRASPSSEMTQERKFFGSSKRNATEKREGKFLCAGAYCRKPESQYRGETMWGGRREERNLRGSSLTPDFRPAEGGNGV
ncbi:hypothetical protein TNCV_4248701 [Trichonephila clavipes]|nr:hypothetical protein TNCV_4248701 [Trichonephila clavipes]